MNIVLFGATGMVGRGALIECLEDDSITSVLVVGRNSCGVTHTKLQEILHSNFLDFSPIQSQFASRDACLYCVGVSSVGVSAEKYYEFTYTMTMAAARAMSNANAAMTFCFVSAQGASSGENSATTWGNVKGKTENDIAKLPFKASYAFRPGIIQPLKGVTSRTFSYRVIYSVIGPVIPLLLRVFPGFVTTSVRLGRALINVAARGYPRRVLENRDINLVAELSS